MFFLGKNMTERRREADPGVRTEKRRRKGKGKNFYFLSFLTFSYLVFL
jgi:hypothetical protein